MLRLLWLTVLALLLGGCASGPRVLESQVQSYSSLAQLPSPPTYRFERLPSQQAPALAQQQQQIEAQAEIALARVGLQRDDARAQLLAQLELQRSASVPLHWPYYGADPWYGRLGWGLSYGGHWGWGVSMRMDTPPTLHRYQLSLRLRSLASNQVVYETSARYEDIWTLGPASYGLLLTQALSGFPRASAGPVRVRTEVPRTAPAVPAPAPAPSPAPAPTR